MDSRYHLSTLEIMSWAKKQKIFFKHLKALWGIIYSTKAKQLLQELFHILPKVTYLII